MYFVYMVQCGDGSLYTGITTDLARRLAEHKAGTGGHYTRSREVLGVVYAESVGDRSLASKREAAIKKLTKAEKLDLIRGEYGILLRMAKRSSVDIRLKKSRSRKTAKRLTAKKAMLSAKTK